MEEFIFLYSPFLVGGGGGIKAVTTAVPLQKVQIYCQIVSRSHLIPNLISPKIQEAIKNQVGATAQMTCSQVCSEDLTGIVKYCHLVVHRLT